MRILSALVFGYYMVVGRIGAEVGAPDAAQIPTLPGGMTAVALNEVDRALGHSLANESGAGDPAAPRRSVTVGRVLFIPDGCRSLNEPFDLVVHFHGAPTAMEPAFEKSGLGGVLAIMNLGNGSGKYEEYFPGPRSFEDFLGRVQTGVQHLCPEAATTFRRIALSAWSAGYGSIWKVLDRPASADRVDAVLLADGLHAGFDPEHERQRVVNPAQMAAFALFAERAAAGEKLMAITHSSITTTYASTTETAGFLIDDLDLERVTVDEQGPRPNMIRQSRAERGGFHVLGYAGGDKEAHCDHLHAIGETLFPFLVERWLR